MNSESNTLMSNRVNFKQVEFDVDWLEGGEFLTGALRLGAQNPGTTFVGYQLVDEATAHVAMHENEGFKGSVARFEEALRQIRRHSENSQWRHPLRFRIETDTVYQDMITHGSHAEGSPAVNAVAKIQQARIETYAVDREWQRIDSSVARLGIYLPYFYSDRREKGVVWLKSDHGPGASLLQYQKSMFNAQSRYFRTMEPAPAAFLALPLLVPQYEHTWMVALAYELVLADYQLKKLCQKQKMDYAPPKIAVTNWNPTADGEPVSVTAEHVDLMRRFTQLGWAIEAKAAVVRDDEVQISLNAKQAFRGMSDLYALMRRTPTESYAGMMPRWIEAATALLNQFMKDLA